MDDVITVRNIATTLRNNRYGHANEIELHSGIEQVLTGMGLTVRREVSLSREDRIDMTTELTRPDGTPVRLGIEVKVKGPAGEVHRQLRRYASHVDQVDALLLVTTMYRHMIGVLPHALPAGDAGHAGTRWLLAGIPFEVALINRGSL